MTWLARVTCVVDLVMAFAFAIIGEWWAAALLFAMAWGVTYKRRDIMDEDGRLYLTRWRVFGWMPGSPEWMRHLPAAYVHRFHRYDHDRALHNHPWKWAWSCVLRGAYLEETFRDSSFDATMCRHRGRWSSAFFGANYYHRVVEVARLGGTWTLFVVGPKRQSWGFWIPGRGHVDWRERLRERGIEPQY